MPNTYSQLHVQIVFPVKNRASLIHSSWEEKLYKYTTGIVQNNGQKLLAINGMPDHIHILIGMTTDCCLSDLVREIKKSSNNFINENKLTSSHFEWQQGFGAFSYSKDSIPRVAGYIQNQKTHHQQKTFKQEYIQLLEEFDVDYKPEYIFQDIE